MRIDGLLCGAVAAVLSNAALVIVSFGKFWVGFGWFLVVLDSFRPVAGGFKWLRVVSDGFGWFTVLVVTSADQIEEAFRFSHIIFLKEF